MEQFENQLFDPKKKIWTLDRRLINAAQLLIHWEINESKDEDQDENDHEYKVS